MKSKSSTFIQKEDEAAILQIVQRMQGGLNTKNGDLFASAFAKEHDYVIISGEFIPNYTREDNARTHQKLFDGMQVGALGGNLKDISGKYNVAKVRFLSPEIAVVHIQGHFWFKDNPDKNMDAIITTVMQKGDGKWEIVAFHNSPLQNQKEEQKNR